MLYIAILHVPTQNFSHKKCIQIFDFNASKLKEEMSEITIKVNQFH